MVEYVNKGERWTEAEDDFLRENYGKAFAKFLAIRMGRSTPAIRVRAGKLALTKPNRLRKDPPSRPPPASNACYLRKGAKVMHRLKKNEYVLLGLVLHANSGMWFAAERTLCYSNPRAGRYRTMLKAESLILVSEYKEWYRDTHAGCKPPARKQNREEAVKSAGESEEGHGRVQGRRAA